MAGKTSNIEIERYIRENTPAGWYRGMIFGDQSPVGEKQTSLRQSNGGYLVNIDSSCNSGTHWTALVIKGKLAVYIDSTGNRIPAKILNGLQSKGFKIVYSDSRNQQEGNNCGVRAALALKFLSRARTESDLLKLAKEYAEF